MKRILCYFIMLLAVTNAGAQRQEVHILSCNDMHAAIEAFPQLADIADSLRALYPGLLVLSAGDNRTGEPFNDMYDIPAYPMVALMNQTGFDATTLGNHEFDSGAAGLARLIGLSSFSYICANVHPDASLNIYLVPCKVFDVNGVKVGIVGAVQLGSHGCPDSHPDNLKGINFTPVNETVKQYEWLKDKCDVLILLSHNGFEADVESSSMMPWVDLIVGGHTHTQIDGGEMHNGILITQNVNKLKNATHTTLVIENGQVVDKHAESIDVRSHKGINPVVAEMVRFFSSNPAFQRVLTQVEQPFTNYEELGCMMCDAFVSECGADVAIENAGGVRYDQLPAGSFTVADVLRLDPFGNDAVVMEITGDELHSMLLSCYENDSDNFPFVSGIECTITKDRKNPARIKKLVVTTPDGKKLDRKKIYRVVTNSYVASICDAPRRDQGKNLNRKTADIIISYLKGQATINYKGKSRVVVD